MTETTRQLAWYEAGRAVIAAESGLQVVHVKHKKGQGLWTRIQDTPFPTTMTDRVAAHQNQVLVALAGRVTVSHFASFLGSGDLPDVPHVTDDLTKAEAYANYVAHFSREQASEVIRHSVRQIETILSRPHLFSALQAIVAEILIDPIQGISGKRLQHLIIVTSPPDQVNNTAG